MTDIIITDSEYTTWKDALQTGWSGPGQHREIVQLAAARVTSDFSKVIETIDLMVVPKINPKLSPFFIELTGIKQTAVDNHGMSFPARLDQFWSFSENGTLPVICMNADEAVVRENCRINEVQFPFENSWHRLRPYLDQIGIDISVSSGDLHKLTHDPLKSNMTHYALHDVLSMVKFLRHISADISYLPTGAPTVDPRVKGSSDAKS